MVIIVIRKNICILSTPKKRTGFGHGWALIPFKSPCSITIIFWDSSKKSCTKSYILNPLHTFPSLSAQPWRLVPGGKTPSLGHVLQSFFQSSTCLSHPIATWRFAELPGSEVSIAMGVPQNPRCSMVLVYLPT